MHFITLIHSTEEGKTYDDHRCVGYYERFKDASEAVENNYCDIWEYYYDYAVIELIPSGLFPYDNREYWYKWNDKEKGYEICEQPEFAKGIFGWALG